MNFADVRFWGILAASLLAILMIRLVVVKVMRPDPGSLRSGCTRDHGASPFGLCEPLVTGNFCCG
jgi:hypothetical protein